MICVGERVAWVGLGEDKSFLLLIFQEYDSFMCSCSGALPGPTLISMKKQDWPKKMHMLYVAKCKYLIWIIVCMKDTWNDK